MTDEQVRALQAARRLDKRGDPAAAGAAFEALARSAGGRRGAVLLLDAARGYRQAAADADADRALQHAIGLFERVGDVRSAALTRARAADAAVSYDRERAIRLWERAAAGLGELPAERGRVHQQLAERLMTSEPERSAAHARCAARDAALSGDVTLLGMRLVGVAGAYKAADRPGDTEVWLRRAEPYVRPRSRVDEQALQDLGRDLAEELEADDEVVELIGQRW